MIYWYYKSLRYAPPLDVQQRHREQVFKGEDVIKIGTGTNHPCTSLGYFNQLKAGDVVGMSSVVMLSTRLDMIHKYIKSAHKRQIWLYIHDIGYDDRPGADGNGYALLEKFLDKLITYKQNSRGKKTGMVGRPGYYIEDLTLDQKNVIFDLRDGLLNADEAQSKLADHGLYISERTVYNLQRQLNEKMGKKQKKRKSWAE